MMTVRKTLKIIKNNDIMYFYRINDCLIDCYIVSYVNKCISSIIHLLLKNHFLLLPICFGVGIKKWILKILIMILLFIIYTYY